MPWTAKRCSGSYTLIGSHGIRYPRAFPLHEKGYPVRVLRSSLFFIVVVAGMLGCADRREPVAWEHLREQIVSQSNGTLALSSVTKTNGFDHEREGMKLHTIEWEASLLIKTDGWKAGWRDFQVLSAKPNALAAAVEGVSVSRFLKGATAVIQGKSELQKADRGWRVLHSEVTTSKLLPPPDAPGEGRSTDIQAFFNAFKDTVVTKDTQLLAKFVRFPYRRGELPVNEADFRSGKFPFSDEQVQTILKVQAPKKYQDGFSVVDPTDQFALFFNKDADGYWKWTEIYLAEEVPFEEGPEGEFSPQGTESNTASDWMAPPTTST